MTQPSPPFTAPRYCARSFPPYRYIEGESPHPTLHPEGHSRNAAPDATAPVAPDAWRDSPAYLFGIDLYNHGYWWEAHESLEALWQTTDKRGVQGRFLQGLIHMSAAHIKLHVRRPHGVSHYLTRGTRYLRFTQDAAPAGRYMGLDLGVFIPAVRGYLRAQTAGSPEGWRHDPNTYPYIRLDG